MWTGEVGGGETEGAGVIIQKRICIIGAGLAGGILASKLAEYGHRVTLIEQGRTPAPLIPEDEVWQGSDLKSVYTRGEGIGGTSNFWHGGLIVLDKSDVEGMSPSGSGPKYPMSYAHLCDYYRAALRLITNDEICLEDLMPSGIQEEGFQIDQKLFRLKPLFFPRKPFSTRDLLDDARRKHGLEILTHFKVERLIFAESSQATWIEGFNQGEAHLSKIPGDIFILCAGGIGSPKVLLKSARSNPRLQELPIGRFLIDHPTGFVFKAKLRNRVNLKNFFGKAHHRSSRFRRRWGVILKADRLSVASQRNHVLYLRPAFTMRNPRDYNVLKSKLVGHRGKKVTLWEKLQLIRYIDLLMESVNFRWGLFTSVRYVSGFVFSEQLAATENAVVLMDDGRFVIRWSIAPEDQRSLEDVLLAFFESHKNAFEESVLFPDLLGSGAHHSGGCRMASNASDGVVDRDLRVFGMNNVFVADGSVIGYSGHANTGLTIAALALKCFDVVHDS